MDTTTNTQLKACCRDDANLGPVEAVSNDVTFRRCAVCGCRHFEALADPGHFGVRGAGLRPPAA
jgi:hypothetical protein